MEKPLGGQPSGGQWQRGHGSGHSLRNPDGHRSLPGAEQELSRRAQPAIRLGSHPSPQGFALLRRGRFTVLSQSICGCAAFGAEAAGRQPKDQRAQPMESEPRYQEPVCRGRQQLHHQRIAESDDDDSLAVNARIGVSCRQMYQGNLQRFLWLPRRPRHFDLQRIRAPDRGPPLARI